MDIEDLDGYQLCHVDPKKPGAILRERRVTQNMTQQQAAIANITLRQYQIAL